MIWPFKENYILSEKKKCLHIKIDLLGAHKDYLWSAVFRRFSHFCKTPKRINQFSRRSVPFCSCVKLRRTEEIFMKFFSDILN